VGNCSTVDPCSTVGQNPVGIAVNDHQRKGRVYACEVDQRMECPAAGHASRDCRLGIVVVLAVLWSQAAAAQVAPEPDTSSAVGRYIDQYVERVRIEARGRLLAKQVGQLQRSERVAATGEDLGAKLAAMQPPARQAVAALLTGAAQPVDRDLQQTVQELDRQIAATTATWRNVRTAVCESGALLGRVREEQDTGAASLLSLDDRWFWASVVAALAGLAGVSFHIHRHGLRRRLGGRLSRTVARWSLSAGFALLACVVAGLGVADRLADARHPPAAEDSDTPLQRTEADLARLESEVPPLVQTVEAAAKTRAGLAEASGRRLTATSPDLSAAAAGFRDRVLEVGERLAVLESLPQALQADLDELTRIREDLQAAADASAQHRQWQRGIRSGIGLAMLGVAVAGAWLLRRGVRRRRAAVANTCPLCLGTIHAGAASPNGRTTGASKIVRCKNVLDPSKNIRCDYAIRDAYRVMPKLCFPTLGVPRAGKTHWLAMLYWQLNRGNYPRSLRFERVRPVEAASGEDFDRIVEQILISRMGTTGTQGTRIPHPLVFNFSDHDRWGLSSLLVNIFDYSGEVTATLGADDYRRRRAMQADGYFFFLDPTLPAEPQAKALAEFREDLRLVKGVASSRGLRLPLALCVSKIDLLARQSYALPDGGDAVAKFYADMAQIDPTGEAMTLDVIEARSQLVAGLRDTIWPGWNIQQTVEDVFRGRCLYFPVTPVGLDGRGESDLNLRTIAPFGLLEPLVWLLHMNGYPVLE
jgi:hypothetical protein